NAGHDAGITGHDNPELLVTLARNTHQFLTILMIGSSSRDIDLILANAMFYAAQQLKRISTNAINVA
ncbi:hypothetical protein, partial [Caballeronia choica]|uniref:hypothetical protein n=1 Tax=Caballeronia choica TaxID=326476 RepID=UPI000A693D0A